MNALIRQLVSFGALFALATVASSQKRIVAYLPNWGDISEDMGRSDLHNVTHIAIAFENPVNSAGDLSFQSIDDSIIARAHALKIKVLLSIGGESVAESTEMTARYFDLQSAPKRHGFVAKLNAYLTRHHFDGLDVDLEDASIGKDYTAFVQELAATLGPEKKLLSAAVSGKHRTPNITRTALTRFDFVNIMAYDETGPWNPGQPGPHSSIEFAREAIAYWTAQGVPKNKIVLGVPFYGYGFGSAYRNGGYNYSEIVQRFPGSENHDQVGKTIFYNGIPTIRAKARLVVQMGLGGMMIWQLAGDDVGPRSLLGAISAGLQK